MAESRGLTESPQTILLEDQTRENWHLPGAPRPIRVTAWVPQQAGPLPLALLSHGTGGSIATLAWLGEHLCEAGWLVVGVDHHGNTAVEEYAPEGFSLVWERPRDLSFALDWALSSFEVDQDRITAVGFSLGGYSVAALAGARLNAQTMLAVLTGAVPVPPLPEFPDLVERLAERYPPTQLAELFDAIPDVRDARVSRIGLLAPAIGPLLDASSLGQVAVPALVAWGEADDIAPAASNALIYAEGIPDVTRVELGPDVNHWTFLAAEPAGAAVRTTVSTLVAGFLSS